MSVSFDNLTNHFAALSLEPEEPSVAFPPVTVAEHSLMQGWETQKDAAVLQKQGKAFLLYVILFPRDLC